MDNSIATLGAVIIILALALYATAGRGDMSRWSLVIAAAGGLIFAMGLFSNGKEEKEVDLSDLDEEEEEQI